MIIFTTKIPITIYEHTIIQFKYLSTIYALTHLFQSTLFFLLVSKEIKS